MYLMIDLGQTEALYIKVPMDRQDYVLVPQQTPQRPFVGRAAFQ